MSCWRVLALSGAQDIPQLLIKPRFASDAYTVFLTDLHNIWSEELDLSSIVRRAAEVESPIEVSGRDTAQLAILFENIQRALNGDTDASCSVTRTGPDGITLHASISLPEPLDLLTWKFHLRKRNAVTLKDELILPLLVSSHIQHERIRGLLSVISDKDRAITRLVDQYESSNLDLAAAFPSIGNANPRRRIVKREQAARHIPGLQTFDPGAWRKETEELADGNVSTLGLFQEALSECTPKVPPRLKSEDEDVPWWESLSSSVDVPQRPAKSRALPKKTPVPARAVASDSETEEETEDEFETHENFRSRDLAKVPDLAVEHESASNSTLHSNSVDDTANGGGMNGDQDDDEDEDDEDLDAPPRSQNQSQSQSRRALSRAQSSMPQSSPPKPTASPTAIESSPKKANPRGFKIGGKPKRTESPPPVSQLEISKSPEDVDGIPTRSKAEGDEADTKAVKKGFKIGGRSKAKLNSATATEDEAASRGASRDTSTGAQKLAVDPSASTGTRTEKQATPVVEVREETEEEKVERKRRELKRKNEELAKKQAQSKKKKRF